MKINKMILIHGFVRIWPPIVYTSFVCLNVFSDDVWGFNDPYSIHWPSMTFYLLLLPYLTLVYYFLPSLIFPFIETEWKMKWMFYIFAATTAGIGPVLLYWWKVDKKFSEYIRGISREKN